MKFFLKLAIALGGALVFLAFTIDLAHAVDLPQPVTLVATSRLHVQSSSALSVAD